MASGASGINAHAAMTPELMRDIKNRAQGTRSLDRLTGLESDNKHPNLIWGSSKRSGPGPGAFVKQRQAAFLRTTSHSSSQSSIGSPGSDRSDRSLTTNNRTNNSSNLSNSPSASSNGLNRPLSASLPRIPSKTLADRGFSRPGDIKRGGEDQNDVERKVRRLSSSQESHRSSLTSLRSSSSSGGKNNTQQDRHAATSSNASSRRSSLRSEKNGDVSAAAGSFNRLNSSEGNVSASHSDSRPSSSRSDKNSTSVGSSRPSSSSSERQVFASYSSSRPSSSHSADGQNPSSLAVNTSFRAEKILSSSTPRETVVATTTTTVSKTTSRQSSTSEDKGSKGGDEKDDEAKRGSTGYSYVHKSYKSSSASISSKRASQDNAVIRAGKRPSFHTIQGSSTPVLQRHARSSSNASSTSSPPSSPPPPPPPPFPSEDTASLGRRDSDLSKRRVSLPLPPTQPTPPLSPADTKDKEKEKEAEAVEMRAKSLYQPRPPSELSAYPLPTPPPTPLSSDGHFSNPGSPALPSPLPPLSPFHLPLDVFPELPPVSSSSSSSSSSSRSSSPDTFPRKRNEQSLLNKSGSDLEFFSSLPDLQPRDDKDGGGKTGSGGETAPTAAATAATTTSTSSEHTVEKTRVSEEATTVSHKTTTSTTTSSSKVTPESREGSAPIIHFPPPPSYSPSLSPDLSASRVSASTSPMSPANETTTLVSTSAIGPSSVSTLDDTETRLTSTSTDVVLGYLDNALSGFSVPPTPNDPLSPLPVSPPATETSTASDVYNDEVTGYSVSSNSGGVTKTTTTTSTMMITTTKKQSSSPFKIPDNPVFASSSENVTSGTVTSSQTSLDGGVERLVLLPRKKAGTKSVQAKRKLSSTQKYEGSVKTVRRQIKPGHVEELREMFLQQQEEEEEEERRRRRRRSRRARKSRVYGEHGSDDNDNDDSDGSGYSSTSSDNEYDLEHAEMINSPDYSSSSAFSTPRAASKTADYERNWEQLSKTSKRSTSSGEDLARAKKAEESERVGSSGFVPDNGRKEQPTTSLFATHDGASGVGGTSLSETTTATTAAFSTQQGHGSDAKDAPIITTEESVRVVSTGDPISAVNGGAEDDFTASLPPLDLQDTEYKLAEAVVRTKTAATVVEGREKTSEGRGNISATTTTTTTTVRTDDWQTRSSGRSEDGIDDGHTSNAVFSSSPLGKRTGNTEPTVRTSAAVVTTSTLGMSFSSPSSSPTSSRSSLASFSRRITSSPPTGSALRPPQDSNLARSLRDDAKYSGVDSRAPSAVQRERSDRQEVMDANYARGDEVLSVKVTGKGEGGGGERGEKQGAVTTTTISSSSWRRSAETVGGESGLPTTNNATTREEDRMTIFGSNDRNHSDDDARKRQEEEEDGGGKQSAVSVTVTTTTTTTATSSTTFTNSCQTTKESREFFSTSSSSSLSRPALFGEEEDNVASGQRGEVSTTEEETAGSVATKHRNSLTLGRERLSSSDVDKPSSPTPDTVTTSVSSFTLQLQPTNSVESVSSRSHRSAHQPKSGDDFLSLLDNIQLDSEGFKTESVKRASKLITRGDGIKGNSKEEEDGGSVLVPESASGFDAADGERREEEREGRGGEGVSGDAVTVEQRRYSSTLNAEIATPEKLTARTQYLVTTTTADAAIQSSSTNITDDDKAITTTATKQQGKDNTGIRDNSKDKMAAVLGEITSFNQTTKSSRESSSAFQSSVPSSSSSSRAVQEDAGDVYVYRDHQGDVYVMQDITGQQGGTITPATTAAMKTADDDSTSYAASFDFQGLSSSDSVTVDTDHVDARKAREVISAFFSNTDGSTAAVAGRDGEQLRGESTISLRGGQEHELSRSFDRSFEVVAGNVGMKQFSQSLSTTAEEEEAAAGTRAGRQDLYHQNGSYGHQENQNLNYVTTGNVGYYSPSTGTYVTHQQTKSDEGQGRQQMEITRSSIHSQYQQPQLLDQNQQSLTVSTTSTAVVGEESEVRVNVPRNAIHVLPAFPGSPLRSTRAVLREEPVPDERDFTSSLPPVLQTTYSSSVSLPPSQNGMSSSSSQRDYSSSSTLHASQNEYGSPGVSASTNFERHNRSYGGTSASEGVDFSHLRRRSDSSMSSEDGKHRVEGNRMRYRISNLARSDSDKLNASYTSASSLKKTSHGRRDVGHVYDSTAATNQQPQNREASYKSMYLSSGVYGSAKTPEPSHDTSFSRTYVTTGIYDSEGTRPDRDTGSSQQRASSYHEARIYDNAARQNSYDRSRKVTVINNANTSFGENDSQYGSQTSKATSAGDVSPTNTTAEEQHLYRITRSADTTSASLCPSSPVSLSPPPPPPQRFTTTSASTHRILDKHTRATVDYQQRELNLSHDAIFMPQRSSNQPTDVWRVDMFSRSEPDLTLPLLSKTLSLVPSEQEDASSQRYRLVHTDHSGQKVRTRRASSSDSDESDSGVEGGRKRYRTVTRVQIQGPKRSNSTGSLTKSSELSVFRSPTPPPSRDYRVSQLQRQSSWERGRKLTRDLTEDHTAYRVTKVSSTEKDQSPGRDLSPETPEANTSFRTVGNVSPYDTKPRSRDNNNDAGDENNNNSPLRPYRVVHAQSSEKSRRSVKDGRDLPTRAEITSRVWTKPTSRSFDEDDDRFTLTSQQGRRVRSASPAASDPGERHRTVISIKVNEDNNNNNFIAPATHYTETDKAHYRVVNVKSSEEEDQSSARREERDTSFSGGHGGATTTSSSGAYLTRLDQSFPSPVSGYESDLERGSRGRESTSSTTSSKMYTVLNTSTQQHHQQQQQQMHTISSLPTSGTRRRPESPTYDNLGPAPSPSGGRRYVVSSTHDSNDTGSRRPKSTAFVEEESVSLREVKPRVLSAAPLLSPTGEWHKTTLDVNRNRPGGHSDRSNPHTLAPIQQQRQSKSYIVFNSSDNIRDIGRREDSVTRPTTSSSVHRPHSQNSSTWDRQFRVTSPVPTDDVTAPNWALNSSLDRANWNLNSSRADWNMNSNRATVLGEADNSSPGTFRREVYEEKTYEMRQEGTHLGIEPEPVPDEETDLRVLRGKILIQNRLDESRDQDDFMDNMNVFDNSFHLGKDNPLYQSDPDIYKSLEAELQEQERASQNIGKEVTQDITWETVDRIAKRHKGGQVELSPKPRRKQNLSSMLLSKLASIDSKDIHQHIDVQHHNEEVYGDVHLVHADGSSARSSHTSNFDSVHENVELMLKQGKAFVVIKVIAERIVPIDYEFNVWRKSQAIVTRNIEIDLKANDQRRRLYEHVMDTGGRMPGALEAGNDYGAATMRSTRMSGHGEEERQLTSLETLRLFSQILDVTEGKGDQEDTEMKTRQEMGRLPSTSASAMDLLY